MKSNRSTQKKTLCTRKAQESGKRSSISKGKKAGKSMRGRPELYDEIKKPYSIGITATGVKGLDALSQSFNLSRSEFVEQIGRGILKVAFANTPAVPQEQISDQGIQTLTKSVFLLG